MTSHGGDNKAQTPLLGVLLCCTAIAPEERSKMALIVQELGGLHKLDLTSDVTHLIAGDTNTPKYRYVARERTDIKVLSSAWLEDVRKSWMNGEDTDVVGLEKRHRLPTFAGLRICLTGFDVDQQRTMLVEQINGNGATHHPDLTKRVTHLVAAAPQGSKYSHALQWGIKVVSPEWISDSIARGMALDETYYNPLTPADMRGKDSVLSRNSSSISLGKRSRVEDESLDSMYNGKRKLRRTTSAKLGSQHDGIWADIGSAKAVTDDNDQSEWQESTVGGHRERLDHNTLDANSKSVQGGPQASHKVAREHIALADPPEGIFGSRVIRICEFDERKERILKQHLIANGAIVTNGNDNHDSGQEAICIVPHDRKPSRPRFAQLQEEADDSHVSVVTEWWVERCIHYNHLVDFSSDMFSQPIKQFPINGFSKETICPTSFTGIDLLHFSKMTKLLGAKYDESLNPSTTILITNSPNPNVEKMSYALKHDILVVTMDWIWDCVRKARYQDPEPFTLIRKPEKERLQDSSNRSIASDGERSSLDKRDVTRSDARHTNSSCDVRRSGRSSRLELSLTRKPQPRTRISMDRERPYSQPPELTRGFEEDYNRAGPDGWEQTSDGPALEELPPHVNSPEKRSLSGRSAILDKARASGIENMKFQRKVHDGTLAHNEAMEPVKTVKELTNDISHLLATKTAVATLAVMSDYKALRRHRPLGRATSNPSSLSTLSRSNPNLSSISRDEVHRENDKEVDPSNTLKLEDVLPSQILSYEEDDAPEVRERIMRRMGLNASLEWNKGMQRVESIGMVKDSASSTADRAGNRRRPTRKK